MLKIVKWSAGMKILKNNDKKAGKSSLKEEELAKQTAQKKNWCAIQ